MLKQLGDLKVLLSMHLTLLEQNRKMEESWLAGLAEAAKAVDGVLLSFFSWREYPDLLADDLARRFIDECHLHRIPIFLTRRLWITWPHIVGDQQPLDLYDPAYYAAALHRLAVEVDHIGAAGTAIDAEPYGDGLYAGDANSFRHVGFTSSQRALISEIIAHVAVDGIRPTFARPGGGLGPEHHGWIMGLLGEAYMFDGPTYKRQNLEGFDPQPPLDHKLNLEVWGSWLKPEPGDNPPGERPVNPKEFLKMNWKYIGVAYPELEYVKIHTERADLLPIMYFLGKAADEG